MQTLQHLLTHVKTITKKNTELLDATGGRFNMFKVIGVNHYENTHSAILAELLNPKGTHGLKDRFLESFIDTIKLKAFITDFDCHSALVRTEVDTGNGRIDILIKDNKNHAIIIENKIYANDQWEQLKRYNHYAFEEFKQSNYKIYYLTLNGLEASEDSGGGVNYVPISYNNEILAWLEQCVNISARFPLVRETINQYINHIKKLTNQDMDTKNKEEIVKILLSSKENIEASFAIMENVGALKEDIVAKYFNPQIIEIADELNLIALPLGGRCIYAGFGFKIPAWNYFYIYFEFDGSDWMKLGYMYKLIDSKNVCSSEIISKLSPSFKRHNENKTIPTGWTYLTKYDNWNLNAYLAIISGEMKEEIKKIVLKLIDQANGLEM